MFGNQRNSRATEILIAYKHLKTSSSRLLFAFKSFFKNYFKWKSLGNGESFPSLIYLLSPRHSAMKKVGAM